MKEKILNMLRVVGVTAVAGFGLFILYWGFRMLFFIFFRQ
jgi:hypothetical protein